MSDNMVKQITADDLRKMEYQEGLVLQGCGGDPREWVDGINGLLTEAGILLDGSVFPVEKVSVFQHDGLTNMLFPFEDVKLAMGRLAMWRLQTHETFGGTWLSDYVPNRLGGFIHEEEMFQRVTACEDYNKALNIISEYVDTELSGHTQTKKSHQKKGHDTYER